MRTDDPRPRPTRSARSRLRDATDRARVWLSDLGARGRLALGAIGLAALVAAGYYAASAPAHAETAWLFDDRAPSAEDARRILAALAVAKIPAEPGPRNQVAVPSARKADALALLAKQKLLPRTIREIQDEANSGSMLAWPVDRAEHREQIGSLTAQAMIRDLEGIEDAEVIVGRSTGRGTRGARLAALVRIQPREGRPVPPQTIKAIRSILKTTEPDLPDDALRVFTRSGRVYLEPGNPEASAAMMAQARQEEMRAQVLAALDWIDGVRVLVTIEPPPPPSEAAPPAKPGPEAPAVVVNGPAEAEPPAPMPPPTTAPVPTPVPGRATILVQVPVTYYLRAYQASNRREATIDELKGYVAKVEGTIRRTIQSGFPASEIASLQIDKIDAAGLAPPPVASADAASIRVPTWLVPLVGGAAMATVALVLIGTRWLSARRPATEPSAVPRAHFDMTGDAGPSARVRDLVRRDPGAAAGVLGRWIGQGETS